MTLLPVDELDLTALQKPPHFLHPDTFAALKAWPYGWLFLGKDGNWMQTPNPAWRVCTVYRAKRVSKLNFIQRQGRLPPEDLNGYALWKALDKAHALIRNPNDADLRAAYEDAIL